MTPWEQPIELSAALAARRRAAEEVARSAASSLALPLLSSGSTPEAIAVHERCLGRPLPAQIRSLYNAVEGIHRTPAQQAGSYLLPLSESRWLHASEEPELADLHEIDPAWDGHQFFAFAATSFGDWITLCEHPPGQQPPVVVMLDHECVNDLPSPCLSGVCTPIVVLANSLQQWLQRWCDCGFEEFCAVPGDDWEPSERLRNYLEDHVRLNPTVRWARGRLAALTGES